MFDVFLLRMRDIAVVFVVDVDVTCIAVGIYVVYICCVQLAVLFVSLLLAFDVRSDGVVCARAVVGVCDVVCRYLFSCDV